MTAIQYICAKVGMVSGQGLAGVLRRHYPRWVFYAAVAALVVANTINAVPTLGLSRQGSTSSSRSANSGSSSPSD